MTLQKAINRLEAEYEKAKNLPFVRNPVAYALYQVWRMADEKRKYNRESKKEDNKSLFEWHNRLTGSCLAGRRAFVQDRGLSMDGKTTVREFIRLTEDAYGGSTVRKLKKEYGIGCDDAADREKRKLGGKEHE